MQTRRRSRNSQRGGDSPKPKRATKAVAVERGTPRTKKSIKLKKPSGTAPRSEKKRPIPKLGVSIIDEHGNLKLTASLISFATSVGIDVLREDTKDLIVRKFLDPLRPAYKQCDRVINPIKRGDTCYICGEVINTKYKKWTEYNAPACDHVMPVIMATVYLNILKNSRDPIEENLKYEYRWTHVLCNSQKSDLNLVSMNASGMFVPSKVTCMMLLKKIRIKSGMEFASNMAMCYDRMCRNALNPLCNRLNAGNAQNLLALAGISIIYQRLEHEKQKLPDNLEPIEIKEFIKNNAELEWDELLAAVAVELKAKNAPAVIRAASEAAVLGGGEAPKLTYAQYDGLQALANISERALESPINAINAVDAVAEDLSKASRDARAARRAAAREGAAAGGGGAEMAFVGTFGAAFAAASAAAEAAAMDEENLNAYNDELLIGANELVALRRLALDPAAASAAAAEAAGGGGGGGPAAGGGGGGGMADSLG